MHEVGGGHRDILKLLADLIGLVAQHLVEFGHGDLHQPGMRDPGAVVAVAGLALLVLAHLFQRRLVRGRVVLDGNLRGHAAHGVRAALVADADARQGVGAHERHGHGHLAAVGHQELGLLAQLLDVAEDIVPASAIQTGAVVAQFVQNLFHVKRGKNRLDEHGGLDRAARDAEQFLGHHEHVIPQPRFQVVLELGQIEIAALAVFKPVLRVVEEVQREIKKTA